MAFAATAALMITAGAAAWTFGGAAEAPGLAAGFTSALGIAAAALLGASAIYLFMIRHWPARTR